jgi:hypothetical protein
VTAIFWKELLMLAELAAYNVHLVLFLEELLSFSKNVLQFSQL